MDWDLAIKRNSEALIEIVADLFAMLGLVALTDTVSRLPWPTYRAVLRILRPAESCVRRLIVVAARGLVVAPATSRPRTKGPVKAKKDLLPRTASFQLFDPEKRIMLPPLHKRRTRNLGRIHMFNADGELVTIWPPPRPAASPASRPPPAADGMVSATRLSRRLQALKLALDDLPGQARRMARWRARREAIKTPVFRSPLRPGRPPGHRRKPIHEVDEVLTECHGLACWAMEPDTS